MILAIDSGNTRIKWGLCAAGPALARDGGREWIARGARAQAEADQLKFDWAKLAAPEQIVVANVAGDEARRILEGLLQLFVARPIWMTAQASQCGVTNGYADPAQLGPDRWAALIGARQRHAGPSLVVTAGTATTVDMLAANGHFRGGLILPGVELMKKSLALNTAGLPLDAGHYVEEPCNTVDAIESGCLSAQAGAIERAFARLEAGAVCFLSGGAGSRIAPCLTIPVRAVENLALEGLACIAA